MGRRMKSSSIHLLVTWLIKLLPEYLYMTSLRMRVKESIS
jgi:hypothetical protein